MTTPLVTSLTAVCASVGDKGVVGEEKLNIVWTKAEAALHVAAGAVRAHSVDSQLLPFALKEIALFAAMTDVLSLTLVASKLFEGVHAHAVLDKRALAASKMLGSFGASHASVLGMADVSAQVTDIMWQSHCQPVLTAWTEVIGMPSMDPRLVDRGAPWVYAGLLLLERRIDAEARPAVRAQLDSLTGGLPRNVAAAALLQLAAERLVPDAPGRCTPAWLAVSAAVELSRLAMLARGVEGIMDAVFSSIPLDNPVAIDRAQLHTASILARPPLELCSPGDYYRALAPQLRYLLRLAGGNAHLLSETAALTITNALAQHCLPASSNEADMDVRRAVHAAVWAEVIGPLLKPLHMYSQPGPVQADQESGLDGRMRLCSGDDVLGCIEDLHKIVSVGPLPPLAAQALLPHTPALLDLYIKASRAKLRAGFASACMEVIKAIFTACSAAAVVPAVLAMANGSPQDDGTVAQAPQNHAVLSRHASVTFVTSDNAAFELVVYPGRTVDDDGQVMDGQDGASSLPSLHIPASMRHTSGARHTGIGGAHGLSGLFNILGSATGGPVNQVTVNEGQSDPMARAQGLEGGPGQVSAVSKAGADRSNALVDVLAGLKGSSASLPSSVFAALLEKLLSRPGEAENDDEGDNHANGSGLSLAETQLLTALTERLGPRLLRSNLAITQTVARLLALAVMRLGLPVPDARQVGCDEASAAVAEGLVQGPGQERAALAQTDEYRQHCLEMLSTCLGLLTVVLAGPEFVADGEAEQPAAGTSHPQSRGHNRDADEARTVTVWAHAMIPCLAAVSDGLQGQGFDTDDSTRQLSEMSSALRLAILSLPTHEHRNDAATAMEAAANDKPTGTLVSSLARMRRAMELVMDPTPALQANGLLELARLVAADPPDLKTTGQQAVEGSPDGSHSGSASALAPALAGIFDLAVRQLDHGDSYVVLAAVEVLTSLATTHPGQVLPMLLRLYGAGLGSSGAADTDGSNSNTSTVQPEAMSVRRRVKVGEVLFLAARRAGQSGSLPAYAGPMMACMMKIGVGGWRRQDQLIQQLLQSTSPEPMAPNSKSRLVSDSSAPYNLALELADWSDLRASALSGLGETSAYLGHALVSSAGDVIGGLAGVLTMEKGGHTGQAGQVVTVPTVAAASSHGHSRAAIDEDDAASSARLVVESRAKVRRAAALALSRLVAGHPKKAGLDVLGVLARAGGDADGQGQGAPLRDLYRCLQAVADAGPTGEPDALVGAHARDALAAVEDLVNAMLQARMSPADRAAVRASAVPGPALPDSTVPSLSYIHSRERVLPSTASGSGTATGVVVGGRHETRASQMASRATPEG